jgi:hypothetical protein
LCSDKERARGDTEVWRCEGNSVGVYDSIGMDVKFAYDHVFPAGFENEGVYETVGSDIVKSALDGINGTIFAYGVTSSGKTHTMMGDDVTPGIVPHAIAEMYHLIEKYGRTKVFVIKMSMIEIYNEVVNDLLGPSNTNLRLREDNKKGVYVEGLKEERISSSDHALHVVAMGNEHRKIGATAFNEGSSRSHTVIKISIEASDRPEFATDPDARIGRTLSSLTMVDLAGSESAKAEINKNQRVEGSYINKSLLTLGTVIHKLSDGGAAHIPFRDSKLTRILSNSLSGNGARIAVICTITPASTQAEETHNTLKFASRAKTITIETKRNEILDQGALVAKYQQENALLRRQLEIALKEGGRGGKSEASHPEILSLREKIEEEHAAVVEGEQERLRLVERVEELTEALLDTHQCISIMHDRLQSEGVVGDDVSSREIEKLRGILQTLSNELRRLKEGNTMPDIQEVEDNEVTMQAFYAEREFLNEKLEQVDEWNLVLATALEKMKILVRSGSAIIFLTVFCWQGSTDDLMICFVQVASSRNIDPDTIDMEEILSGDFSSIGDVSKELLDSNSKDDPTPLRRAADPNIIEKVMKLEEKVVLAIDALQRKGEKLARQSEVQKTLTGLNEEVHNHIADLTVENQNLKKELERVEAQNEQLQGYKVDHLSEQELLALIGSLTSAVERVRLTVQTKNIAMKTRERPSKMINFSNMEQRGTGMSMEYMSKVISELKTHCDMTERRIKRH